MKSGQSYITITSKDLKHPIIKALHQNGFEDVTVIYASHLATDSGWTLIKSNKGYMWLGYTKDEAIKELKQRGNQKL
jgi:hypothetical protein